MQRLNPRKIQKSYIDKIEDSLSNDGVVFFDDTNHLKIDEEYLTLPLEITEVTSRDLGEYLNAYTQQKVYMRTLLGRAELSLEEAKLKFFNGSADKYNRLSKDKISETSKERMLITDPNTKDLYSEFIDCKHKVDLVLKSIANIEDIIFLLSREVTRRTGDFQEDKRNHNVGGR